MKKIQKGDRVELVYSLRSGIVTAICLKTGKVRVRLDGGGHGWHKPEELVLL